MPGVPVPVREVAFNLTERIDMSHYSIYLTCEASQVIAVDADSLDEALQEAYERAELHANISNKFDMGDPDVLLDCSTCDGEPIA